MSTPQRDQIGDVVPRVRHLEAEVGEIKSTLGAVFDKLNGIATAVAGLQANKPVNIAQIVQVALQLVQTTVLLVGATVAAITYVASKANDGELRVLRRDIDAISQQAQRPSWAPSVTPADTRR